MDDQLSILLNNEDAPWIISPEKFRKTGISGFYASAQGSTTIFFMNTTPALNNAVYVIAAGHRQIAESKTYSGWPFSRPGGGMFFAFGIMTADTLIFANR
jgi:hypothetical protein